MAISTKNVRTSVPALQNKRQVTKELIEYHRELFNKEGVRIPKFLPRMCYKHNDEKVISLYPTEIVGGLDIYIEFCSRELVPEDPKRTLWKWVYNPEFATEYAQSEPHPETKDRRFLIPISELINVTEFHTPKKPPVIITEVSVIDNPIIEEEFITEKEKEDVLDAQDLTLSEDFGAGADVPYDAMTLRDYAAIKWRKPVSHKAWLNELISKTFQ